MLHANALQNAPATHVLILMRFMRCLRQLLLSCQPSFYYYYLLILTPEAAPAPAAAAPRATPSITRHAIDVSRPPARQKV